MVGPVDVTMLVPGFPEFPAQPAALVTRLTLITFGRLDAASDRIKQGVLALEGFATACREAYEDKSRPKLLRDNPHFYLIGIGARDEASLLVRQAQFIAGRALNVLPLPFDEDRDELFRTLRGSHIALMLSWHEGFGLTGWEAIAAGVPLIVSRQSGLYKLIEEKLGGAGVGCLSVLDVKGHIGSENRWHSNADVLEVAKAIRIIAANLAEKRRDAATLKELLRGRLICTWENTAEEFCRGLGLDLGPRVVASAMQVPPGPKPSTQPMIAIPRAEWPDDLGIESPDSLLLRPESGAVPFHAYREPSC